MLSIIFISIIIVTFCAIYSIFLFGTLFTIIYGIPISIKMVKRKMIKNNIVLTSHYLYFVLYLILFFIPLALIYIFDNKYLNICLIGYTIGIISFFVLRDQEDWKKVKQIFVDNYILDFGRYFNDDKEIEIDKFFDNYLSGVSGGEIEKFDIYKLTTDTIQTYLEKINNLRPISNIEEVGLAKMKDNGDKNSERLLIEANLYLVMRIVKGRGISQYCHDFINMINLGNYGLSEAVKNFDYKKGYNLSTYAVWWIRRSIKKEYPNF